MSILIGFLLYVSLIAWLCALTGINRLDDAGSQAAAYSPAKDYPARLPARQAQG